MCARLACTCAHGHLVILIMRQSGEKWSYHLFKHTKKQVQYVVCCSLPILLKLCVSSFTLCVEYPLCKCMLTLSVFELRLNVLKQASSKKGWERGGVRVAGR